MQNAPEDGKMRVVKNSLSDSFTADYLKVYAGPPGSGGASHTYQVCAAEQGQPERVLITIEFQHGARTEVGVNGLLEGTLIQIILDRQQAFQAGDFRCRENALFITKLEEALLWSKARELERQSRNVLGTTKI